MILRKVLRDENHFWPNREQDRPDPEALREGLRDSRLVVSGREA